MKGFIVEEPMQWEKVEQGVQRRIIAYDERLMLVKVRFETGGVGSMHRHPHTQITYVESGVFEIEIDGEKRVLKKGDSYYVAPDIMHGAVCLEQGVLMDSFSPMREDFIR